MADFASMRDHTSYPEGAIFFVRPRAESPVSATAFNQALRSYTNGTVALTENGGYDRVEALPDGTYDVRTNGPATTDLLARVLAHEGWEVVGERSWEQYEAELRGGGRPGPDDGADSLAGPDLSL